MAAAPAIAQKITGTVISGGDKEPLPGVTVLEKGTTNGITTDFDGNFEFNLKDASDQVLVFSFVGYQTQEVPVNGQTKIDVVLQESDIAVDEVVVTALGIKRDKKALSYSSQTISDEDIANTQGVNFASSLSGKTAGVELRESSAGAGGSTKITLRGTRNITSSNQPLFVIDGIPMANYQTSDASGFYGGRDSGDGLSNINQDDIESMTILRGANAAALYGSQGSNGVILITTKKGKNGTTKATFSSNTSITQAFDLPDLQYKYGQTSEGSESSWGEEGDYDDSFVKDFFQTGVTTKNGITLSGGNDKTTTYFSYSNAYSEGVVPTNTFKKNNLTFKQSSKFFDDKLTVTSDVMLTQQKVHNKILNGYYWNPLLGLYNFPRSLDFDDYKNNYKVWDSDRNMWTQNWAISGNSEGEMNPYWILYKDQNDEKTNRIIGNVSLDYQLAEGLNLSARGSYDYTRQIYELKANAGSSSVLVSDNGRYIYSNLESYQAYGDLMLTYDHSLSDDLDLHAVIGTSYQNKTIGDGVAIDSDTYGLTLANVFTIQNISSIKAFSSGNVMDSRLIKESAFANISLGYNNMLYLDLSGRNDWSSSLAYTGNLSYFYPSVGLSAILSQMIQLPEAISFAKVRGSYARVSNEIPAFKTNPVNGVDVDNLISRNSVTPFTDLKPEMQDSYEFGLEMRFLNNRVGLDASVYQIDTKDQYLELDAPSGSYYDTYYVNAGHIRSKGLEITLSTTPVKGKKFSWDSNVNFTTNTNKIMKLSDDLDGYYTMGGGGEGYDMYVVEGGKMGDIYVYQYARDDDGNIILDDDTYVPTKNTTKRKVGNASPKWMMGWTNSFSYKKFNMSFQVDGKFGGNFVSMTNAYLDANGVSQATADAREAGGVKVKGVLSDGSAYEGTVDAQTYYTSTAGRAGIMEQYVYGSTNVRLRQVSLGYNFDLQKYTNLINNINLSLVGSNLFFFYNEAPTDPDITISTGNGSQGVENFGAPTSRSLGFNLQVNF